MKVYVIFIRQTRQKGITKTPDKDKRKTQTDRRRVTGQDGQISSLHNQKGRRVACNMTRKRQEKDTERLTD